MSLEPWGIYAVSGLKATKKEKEKKKKNKTKKKKRGKDRELFHGESCCGQDCTTYKVKGKFDNFSIESIRNISKREKRGTFKRGDFNASNYFQMLTLFFTHLKNNDGCSSQNMVKRSFQD